MTSADAVRFAELMLALSETYREKVSDLRAELYLDALRDLPIESVEKAVRLAIRTLKFFPKPVELRELVTGNTDDEAAREWALVQREVSRVGYMRQPNLPPATMEAIRVVFGSWRSLCGSLPSPDSDRAPELMNWRKQFVNAYDDAKKREARGELPAAGAANLAGLIAEVREWEGKREPQQIGPKVMP
jgi:hypothetical protein